MNIDKIAQDYIAELEADADAQAQRIELLLEEIAELLDEIAEKDLRIKVLEHDLMMLRRDRRHEVA